MRNWLNKERNNNENNKFPFDFIENKAINLINNIPNNMKNNTKTSNSVNIQKSSQMNIEQKHKK